MIFRRFVENKESVEFASWDSFNETSIYKSYKSGFPSSMTWYLLFDLIKPFDIKSTSDGLIEYKNKYSEKLSINATNIFDKRVEKFEKTKMLSAADFLCIFDNNSVFLCEWEQFSYLYLNARYLFNNGIDQLRAAYIFASCLIKKNEKNALKFCPNPCQLAPCTINRNTLNDDCELVDKEILVYNDNYKCKCKDQYEWIQQHLMCKPINQCNLNEYCGGILKSNDCKMVVNDADKIAMGFSDFEIICSCTEKYMGHRCESLRNPCLENFYQELPSGDKACGDHGKCNPKNGTNDYTCECDSGWMDDSLIPYPDCSKPIDKCRAIKCINGYCKLSDNKNHTECICDLGYTGENCELVTGQWLQWMQWQPCQPFCGINRKRLRTRLCSNLKNTDTCYKLSNENETEVMPCDPSQCIDAGNYTSWTNWTDCHPECKKYSHRTRKCIHKNDTLIEVLKLNCNGPNIEFNNCPTTFTCNFLLHKILVIIVISLIAYISVLYYIKRRIRKAEKFLTRLVENIYLHFNNNKTTTNI